MDELVRDDAAHLKSLRQAAGLDIAELATKANLSVGQVRQLEDGGDALFYSPQIKHQALRRVIRLLETPVNSPVDVTNTVERSVVRSGQSVIDDIIRLSEKNLKSRVVTSAVRRPGYSSASWWSMGTGALLLLALIAWQFNRQQTQVLYTEWVEPVTAKVLHMPEVQEEAPRQQLQVEVVPVLQTTPVPVPVTAPIPDPAAVPPATSATEPLAASNTVAADDCTQMSEEPRSIPTSVHSKAGTYVHLFSNKALKVCVDDGKKSRTVLTLTPGVGRSVYGASPWTIASNEMKSLQIYFQGGKVLLPPDTGTRIYLKEQPVSP